MRTAEVDDGYKALYAFFESHDESGFPEISDELAKEVVLLIPHLKVLYPHFLETDDDHRSGEEIYGIKSNDHWNSDLSYISDRWRCTMRVRWMLDLAEHLEEFFKKEELNETIVKGSPTLRDRQIGKVTRF